MFLTVLPYVLAILIVPVSFFFSSRFTSMSANWLLRVLTISSYLVSLLEFSFVRSSIVFSNSDNLLLRVFTISSFSRSCFKFSFLLSTSVMTKKKLIWLLVNIFVSYFIKHITWTSINPNSITKFSLFIQITCPQYVGQNGSKYINWKCEI